MVCATVIHRADELKRNTYSSEEKLRWLLEIEGKIFHEVMRCPGEFNYKEYMDNYDSKELLLKPPYDLVYDYYLFSMIDFHNREFENYANSYAMFNEKFNEFAKAWQRKHPSPMPEEGDSGFFLTS